MLSHVDEDIKSNPNILWSKLNRRIAQEVFYTFCKHCDINNVFTIIIFIIIVLVVVISAIIQIIIKFTLIILLIYLV